MAASLSNKYADLANTAPILQDPEDDIHLETRARIVERNDEDDSGVHLGQSVLRKKTSRLLADEDSRYSGQKITRKSLQDEEMLEESTSAMEQEEDDDDETSEEESEDSSAISDDTSSGEEVKGRAIDTSGREGDDDDDGSDDDVSYDDEDYNMDLVPEKDMVQKFSQIDINKEIEKGKAVKAQLAFWDKLLEIRIKAQKMLSVTNCLPQHNTWKEFLLHGGEEYLESLRKNKRSLKVLLDKLLTIQEALFQAHPDVYGNTTEKQGKPTQSDEEIPSDTEDEEAEPSQEKVCKVQVAGKKRKLQDKELPGLLEKRHKAFVNFRNTTIQKWSDKTRLASGKVGHRSFAAFEQSALKQIEQILSDRDRLRRRTQLKRSSYRVLGQEEPQKDENQNNVDEVSYQERSKKNDHLKDYDAEIFDDDDFYHQLLRELIERKTADINDPIAISRQWLEIQKLRSKFKRKVDTKASKGRKIRFDVHPKLLNFMAPIDHSEMTDKAKDELFNSLFGKRVILNG